MSAFAKFRGDEIFEINGETQCLWIEIVNNSYNEPIKINKNSVLDFAVIEPENLSFKHETTKVKKRKDTIENVELLDAKKGQRDGFLSRYNLTYVGRDTVNQAGKLLLGLLSKQQTILIK